MDNEILTVDQAAELLQMHPYTVRKLLRDGRIPGRKLGPKEWRVSKAELVAFISAGEPAKPEPKKRSTAKKAAKKG